MGTENNRGIWYAISAFSMWGILPLYWHYMNKVPALEILAHRIFWSFLFVALLITVQKKWNDVIKVFQTWKVILAIFGCSLFISANWFIYIWAVNNGHVIETSLGYYINPLISIAFGMLFLRERLNSWQWVALSFALIGVLIQTIEFGQFPWIALSLSVTFALYGLSKKLIKVEAMTSLVLETMMVAPFALGYILFIEARGTGSITDLPVSNVLLLIGSGIITALPLLWFAQGAKRVSLSTLGFIQYLAPTIALVLGVFFFHEHFTKVNFISFGFIWIAILIYSLSQMKLLDRWFSRKSLVKERI
ncbi:EamA family transporter RarD [Shimazuella sp. AN120528]|uniref:EamA family transporter RarD n=1 Tax=Shimazuella soli TaxID=1892854 RepID=UPI001F0DB84E|nr:EamA family transporter RarD [Shimazuella soli]MCH5586666.1 EamA family transporter RarD [Shimazuella soli]